jgi:hypothetical protein
MDDPEARALLAATLALMTQFAETRSPLGARKVQENLLRLSGMGHMPWEFRTVLAKLGARWTLMQEHWPSLH